MIARARDGEAATVAGFMDGLPRPEGWFVLDVFQSGELVEHYEGPNLVTNSGRQAIAYAMGNALASGAADPIGVWISQMGYGSSTAPTTAGTTGIQLPHYLNALKSGVIDGTGQNVTFGFGLAPGEAVGLSIGEFALFTKRVVMFARKNRSVPLVTDANTSLSGTWTISF